MKYAVSDDLVAIRLQDGEKLHMSMAQVCEGSNIDSAVVIGALGMVREVTFGWYTGTEYLKEKNNEVLELLALSGNISHKKDSGIYPHLHATFSRSDHSTLGGHILEVVAFRNLELFLKPVRTLYFNREFDGDFDALLPEKRP